MSYLVLLLRERVVDTFVKDFIETTQSQYRFHPFRYSRTLCPNLVGYPRTRVVWELSLRTLLPHTYTFFGPWVPCHTFRPGPLLTPLLSVTEYPCGGGNRSLENDDSWNSQDPLHDRGTPGCYGTESGRVDEESQITSSATLLTLRNFRTL